MRYAIILGLCLLSNCCIFAQQKINSSSQVTAQPATENIYKIKEAYLQKILHNPVEKEKDGNDNDLAKFNRWFNFMEPRCYPSGNLPHPDVLLQEYLKQKSNAYGAVSRTTSTIGAWQPVGPTTVPTNFYGIGRVNCIIIDPLDTATIYVGAACGGVYISHDAGASWTSNSDNFPSLSIADIAVNPHHTDTLYAATGDGYGYEVGPPYNIFWGGLYSAGVMMSANGGSTWSTTGLSFPQSNNDIIQKLLIHPRKTGTLLAAARSGIYKSTDAGITWTNVYGGHVVSMAFKPGAPDTVYAIDTVNLIVSYNAGATWNILYPGIYGNSYARSSIAVSPAAPNKVWVLNSGDSVLISTDGGITFNTNGVVNIGGSPGTFYGYYDNVLAVSPVDPNYILACGMNMFVSTDGSLTWNLLDTGYQVHVDNHAIAINPLHPTTIYSGNDGGIAVTRDGGATWTNISNGLMISQIYRISTSIQHPNMLLCGLQDNGSFYINGMGGPWLEANNSLGDGMDNAIHPLNDSIQLASTQYGNISLSIDQGNTFNTLPLSGSGYWTAPVCMDPHDINTFYVGLTDVYVTHNMGVSFTNLTTTGPFTTGSTIPGAVDMALCPANTNVLYASDFAQILRTTDGGVTWNDVTGSLPVYSVGITRIAVDYRNPMLVYAVMSGYAAGMKVYVSTTGGTTWNNISHALPNVPVDCITVDSLVAGALFIGTDMGVYYTDSSVTGWSMYAPGLPNVVVDDIDINATNSKVRAATYGRGVWECNIVNPLAVSDVKNKSNISVQVTPNPTTDVWNLVFPHQKPEKFVVTLTDVTGKVILKQINTDHIDASKLAAGTYDIEVQAGDATYIVNGVKK